MTLYQLQLLLCLTRLTKSQLPRSLWGDLDKIEQEVRHEAGLSTHVDKPEPAPAAKPVDHWMGKPITYYTKEELATMLVELNRTCEKLRKENLQYIRGTYLYR